MAGGLVVESLLLALWQGTGYWEANDGVYALTARLMLDGHALYRDVAAAQPPPVYLAGAGMLAVHDSVWSVRAGVALLDLATALLVAAAVLRLTASAPVAVAAGLLAPLLPIPLHEHAQLDPEPLAAPLLLGGALLSARRPTSAHGGVLLALATACKLAFGLPAVLIALAAAERGRALAGAFGAGLVAAAATILVAGFDVVEQTVVAQLQVGRAPVSYVGGLLGQAGWSLVPLSAGAAAAVAFRADAADPALWRTLAAGALGGLLLAASLVKLGSWINVLVVAHPPLLALAAFGAHAAWRRRAAGVVAAVAMCGVLLVAQTGSLLVDPARPRLAERPFARGGLGARLTHAQVDAAVVAARRCPRATVYPGSSYIAFLARRAVSGDQPDRFIARSARANERFARRMVADPRPPCPPAAATADRPPR